MIHYVIKSILVSKGLKRFYLMQYFVFVAIVLLMSDRFAYGQLANNNNQLNTEQAELMISLLQCDNNSEVERSADIENIIKTKGTELIIAQMNLMRKVNTEQYRILLLSISSNKFPIIDPLDSSLGAHKGVNGLKEAWKYMKWVSDNCDLVNERVSTIKNLDIYKKSESMALSNLPDTVRIDVPMFIVIGGRVGAAAISGRGIYYDFGKMSYLHARRRDSLTISLLESELIDFFAHEMHHIGLGKIRERQNYLSGYTPKEQEILRLLNGIVAEGSATYLVSGHRDITKIDFYNEIKSSGNLLQKYEEAMLSILNNNLNHDEYEEIEASFTGNSSHIAGTALLYTIDQAFGLGVVMECIENPQNLLIEYNNAIVKLNLSDHGIFKFNEELANVIYKMRINEN